MTIQEMIARQQAIVTQARNEGRGLSREEQTEFDQLQGKIDTARSAGGQEGAQGGAEPPADGSRGAGDPAGAEGQDGGSDATRQEMCIRDRKITAAWRRWNLTPTPTQKKFSERCRAEP